MTKSEFLIKAEKQHGARYRYNNLNDKIVVRDKIVITCELHGDFHQIVRNHIGQQKQGCPICGAAYAKVSQRATKEQFIEKAVKLYGEKYDYNLVVYVNSKTKVKIKCNVCGDIFEQTPNDHLGGHSCSKCSNLKKTVYGTITKEEYLKKIHIVHGDKYNYDGMVIETLKDVITVTCPFHGDFSITAKSHLNGRACKHCILNDRAKEKLMSFDEFINKSTAIYGDIFEFDENTFKQKKLRVGMTCKVCGKKTNRYVNQHLNHPKQCIVCGTRENAKKRIKTTEMFVEQSRLLYGDKYSYGKTNYVNYGEKVVVTCDEHGDFEIHPNSFLQGHGCPHHFRVKSKAEIEIFDFIRSILPLDIVVSSNNRSVLGGNELDVYIPSKNIAFEYNGLYWHNELNKPNDYHLKKTNECTSVGVRLYHIFEDEWLYKKEVVKSMICNALNITEHKLYGRKCEIRVVNSKDATIFLEANHVQGKCGSSFRYGLYHDSELVSLMAFGSPRHFIGHNKCDFELVRFCNKINTNVIGGASKLFKHFVKHHHPNEIISYADKRWSIGALYDLLGFEKYNESKPNYFYVIGDKRVYRFNMRKSVLIKKYGCDKNMTEKDFCFKQSWFRIYDCGALCYKWKRN